MRSISEVTSGRKPGTSTRGGEGLVSTSKPIGSRSARISCGGHSTPSTASTRSGRSPTASRSYGLRHQVHRAGRRAPRDGRDQLHQPRERVRLPLRVHPALEAVRRVGGEPQPPRGARAPRAGRRGRTPGRGRWSPPPPRCPRRPSPRRAPPAPPRRRSPGRPGPARGPRRRASAAARRPRRGAPPPGRRAAAPGRRRGAADPSRAARSWWRPPRC
jgi:hypothetical protein